MHIAGPLLFSLLLIVSSFSQIKSQEYYFNFGFEQTNTSKKLPNNWFQWGKGYNLVSDTIIKYTGINAVRIEPLSNKPLNSFGCVAYKIPAIYIGQEIELKAYLKFENIEDGSVGLLLRIDGESGVLQFDNMQQKNINGSSDWAQYTIKLPYPSETKNIFIGAIHNGKGQLWADDFELLIDGKDIKEVKRKKIKVYEAEKDHEFDKVSKIDSIEITKQKIENIALLAKIWGFLKYYHPNIAKGDYNWDYELFRILSEYNNVKSINERDKILLRWVKSFGEFEIGRNSTKTEAEIKMKPDLDWITSPDLNKELVRQLTKIRNAKRTGEHYYIKLIPSIGNPEFRNENSYGQMKFPDTGYRLLSLFRYWSIIQYYFPYKYLIEEDWKEVLEEFIPKFINTKNELEYKLTILELIARVHDTHANIWGWDNTLQKNKGLKYTPLKIRFVENKAVVSSYHNEELGKESGLFKGDIIAKINNQTVDDIIKGELKYSPASNYTTQLRNIGRNLLRTNDSIIVVDYVHEGKSQTTKLKTYSSNKINIFKNDLRRDTCFKYINKDIAYLYLGTIKSKYLPQIMEEIKDTKGLVIDLRCYPSEFVVFSLGGYLMPTSKEFVKFSKSRITAPGFFAMTKSTKVGYKNDNWYKGKLIILINEMTQSQAEYTTMAFRVAPTATIIGSTTAGADGNVSKFYLPGGIMTMISGIGVYYPDGRETQRIGIVPDIELKPTIEGIKRGKDEVLEKAIEIINVN